MEALQRRSSDTEAIEDLKGVIKKYRSAARWPEQRELSGIASAWLWLSSWESKGISTFRWIPEYISAITAGGDVLDAVTTRSL
jgi:hypothetical protein